MDTKATETHADKGPSTGPDCAESAGSAIDDRHIPILGGRWAVIFTADDGWEIEHQHSYSTFDLAAKDEQSAIIEGRKLAREIEQPRAHNAEVRPPRGKESNG